MTQQILFIQGGGEGVHDEWDNRMVDSLRRELGPGYEVRYPRMPDEADPDYTRWKAAIIEAIGGLDDGVILVGHSVGGTILVNVLAEAAPARRIAGLILVAAPFVGAGGWPGGEIEPMAGVGARLPDAMAVHLYHGDRDETAPLAHADLYEAAMPAARVHRLPGRDHQLNDDLSEVAVAVRALAKQAGGGA